MCVLKLPSASLRPRGQDAWQREQHEAKNEANNSKDENEILKFGLETTLALES